MEIYEIKANLLIYNYNMSQEWFLENFNHRIQNMCTKIFTGNECFKIIHTDNSISIHIEHFTRLGFVELIDEKNLLLCNAISILLDEIDIITIKFSVDLYYIEEHCLQSYIVRSKRCFVLNKTTQTGYDENETTLSRRGLIDLIKLGPF